MNARILAFPVLVGAVMALDGCDRIAGPKLDGKGCVDTVTSESRRPDGQIVQVTTITRRNPPLCFDPRAAA